MWAPISPMPYGVALVKLSPQKYRAPNNSLTDLNRLGAQKLGTVFFFLFLFDKCSVSI